MPLDALIPLPSSVTPGTGVFTLTPAVRIVAASDGALEAAELLGKYLRPATGFAIPVIGKTAPAAGDIILREKGQDTADDYGFRDESYTLAVSADNAEIEAPNEYGLKRGLQTLRQLLPAAVYSGQKITDTAWTAPAVKISDRPAYRWRGMHFDVSRHFYSVAEVERYIELMAQHKFNVFHWHLTDDQGWRLEIKKYPRLTEIGSVRAETIIGNYGDTPHRYDGKEYRGFYTQSDVKQIVAFAAERGITIVPEIDMPGHMQAAIAAYPELGNNPGGVSGVRCHWGISQNILNPSPETVKFMQNVLGEVIRLFPGRFIHIGGDEAHKYEWENSIYANKQMAELGLQNVQELQSWFIGEMGKYLLSKGRLYIGWDEILEGGLADGAAVMSWRGENGALAAARQGHAVVNAANTYAYFDHYQADPAYEPLAIGGDLPCEKVYRYRPAPAELSPEAAVNVLGGQGQIWTEYIGDFAYVEYMAYPRACAIAEKLWSPEGADTFRGFVTRLNGHRVRFREQGVNAHPLP